jgi:hypothetical protein
VPSLALVISSAVGLPSGVCGQATCDDPDTIIGGFVAFVVAASARFPGVVIRSASTGV